MKLRTQITVKEYRQLVTKFDYSRVNSRFPIYVYSERHDGGNLFASTERLLGGMEETPSARTRDSRSLLEAAHRASKKGITTMDIEWDEKSNRIIEWEQGMPRPSTHGGTFKQCTWPKRRGWLSALFDWLFPFRIDAVNEVQQHFDSADNQITPQVAQPSRPIELTPRCRAELNGVLVTAKIIGVPQAAVDEWVKWITHTTALNKDVPPGSRIKMFKDRVESWGEVQ